MGADHQRHQRHHHRHHQIIASSIIGFASTCFFLQLHEHVPSAFGFSPALPLISASLRRKSHPHPHGIHRNDNDPHNSNGYGRASSVTFNFLLWAKCPSSIESDADADAEVQVDDENNDHDNDNDNNCRRAFLTLGTSSVLSSFAILTSTIAPPPANAFANRLDDKYADATAQIGTQPTDLRYLERTSRTTKGGTYVGLKPCASSPNCWCSSAPFADNPARFIPAWGGGTSKSIGIGIEDVKQVVDTYEVGQNGVDGGGFKIMEYDEKGKYIYVQFQSYKAGYIDDFECWFNPVSQKFDVRSSSRVGMSDLGVNAKRLEYIGGRLEREFGWTLERRKNGSLV
mmetsp:Transcript_6264/g.8988  ORF Transcript_6264/g.8988 Transcript_6264/m.8988 type:complete len:342 (+) Transcript_6264:175-1200(+)